MNNKVKANLNKALIATALTLCITTPSYATVYNITGKFEMFTPTGGFMKDPDFSLTGTFDDTDPNSMTIISTVDFFGFPWVAHDLTVTQTPGAVTVEACPIPADGSLIPEPGNAGSFIPCNTSIPVSMDIANGQWGVHMLFNWNKSKNIDVLNVWDVELQANGSIRLTSTDFDGDGIPGAGMGDGEFQGFNANFDLLLSPPFAINITSNQNGGTPVLLEQTAAAGNVTFDATVIDTNPLVANITYDWSASDAAMLTAAGNITNNAEIIINQLDAGLIPGTTYTLRAAVTKTLTNGDTTLSTASKSIKVTPFNLTAIDTDLDGTNDDIEGFVDTDGDGIPEFLDTSIPLTQLTVNPGDNSLGNVTSNEGILALGDTVSSNATNNLTSASSNNFGAAISVIDIGKNDDNFFKTFCIGGCVDIKVTNLNNSSAQVVIPVSSTLPSHSLFRVLRPSGWGGFIIDENNTSASANANSTGPIDCPTPGQSTYSNFLTQGHNCIQLTIEDGGPNDADGIVNGSVSILGGVAELIISPPTTNGVGGISWLLFSIPALLGFRRSRK